MNGAVFSPDRIWRYTLTRELGGGPRLMVIGLNPSTADETENDPTIRRCIGFAQRWEFGTLVMTNLFAFRSTNPKALYAPTVDVVGLDNDKHLLEQAQLSDGILAAWGAHGSLMQRDQSVVELLENFSIMALGVTQTGHPKHPLYLRADTEPFVWTGLSPRWDDEVTLTEVGEQLAA